MIELINTGSPDWWKVREGEGGRGEGGRGEGGRGEGGRGRVGRRKEVMETVF